MTHDELMASGLHECASDCQRRYTKVGNYYVRRPQATPFRVTASDHLKDAGEALLGVVVLLVLLFGVPFLLWVAFG